MDKPYLEVPLDEPTGIEITPSATTGAPTVVGEEFLTSANHTKVNQARRDRSSSLQDKLDSLKQKLDAKRKLSVEKAPPVNEEKIDLDIDSESESDEKVDG